MEYNPATMKEEKEKYSYACDDLAFSDYVVTKYLAVPLLNLIPKTVRPNAMTLTSGLCALLAFVIMLQAPTGHYHLWFLIPFLLMGYMLLDFMDGMQARRTQMFSPLGEFLDHFFDSAATCYLTGGMLIVYGEKELWVFCVVMVSSYIAQAACFWERYKTRVMHFGRISSTDVIIILTTFITLAGIPSVRNFALMPIYKWINPFRIFVLLSVTGGAFNSVMSIVRSKGCNYKFVLFMVMEVVTAVMLCFVSVSFSLKVILFSLYSMIYLGRLLVAITNNEKDRLPDFFFPIVLIVAGFLPGPYLKLVACFVYLGFIIVSTVINHMFAYIEEGLKAAFAQMQNQGGKHGDRS